MLTTSGPPSSEQPSQGLTVSLVLPCLNEAENLAAVFAKIPPFVTEVLLVDGGSTDGSVERAIELRPDIRVLGQHAPGKGLALVVGLLEATGDVVVMADTDCSTDLDEMVDFVAALEAGADLAKGTRHQPPGGSDDFTRIRRMGNWLLVRTVNVLFGTKWTDLAYGYAAFWTDMIDKIGLQAIYDTELKDLGNGSRRPLAYGHGFEIETLLFCRTGWVGYTVAEVPSHERVRMHGTSNLSAIKDGFRVLHGIRTERFSVDREALRPSGTIAERMAVRRERILARSTATEGESSSTAS